MKFNFTSKIVAGVLAASIVAAPAAAADLGLERDAEAFGGAYFKVPFGGSQKASQDDQMKFGLQLDRKGAGSFGPFDARGALNEKALVDVSFDTGLNMTGLSMNGIDTLELSDRLYQNSSEDDGFFRRNIGWIFVGGALAIILLSDDDDADPCAGVGYPGPDASFAGGPLYADEGGSFEREIPKECYVYDGPVED